MTDPIYTTRKQIKAAVARLAEQHFQSMLKHLSNEVDRIQTSEIEDEMWGEVSLDTLVLDVFERYGACHYPSDAIYTAPDDDEPKSKLDLINKS